MGCFCRLTYTHTHTHRHTQRHTQTHKQTHTHKWRPLRENSPPWEAGLTALPAVQGTSRRWGRCHGSSFPIASPQRPGDKRHKRSSDPDATIRCSAFRQEDKRLKESEDTSIYNGSRNFDNVLGFSDFGAQCDHLHA